MKFEKITLADMSDLKYLQPGGWTDIRDSFMLYVENNFCFPLKLVSGKRIVGLGCSICFGNTAWLAHIIVHKDYRNKGLGSLIVEKILDELGEKTIDSISLIATELGEPLYNKSGFRSVADYTYLGREKTWTVSSCSSKIMSYSEEFYGDVLALDEKISGENRSVLITQYLASAYVYVDNGVLIGFYMPNLGEGCIFATTALAGTELMKMKYAVADKAVLPADNKAGINFLLQNGFRSTNNFGKRMQLGDAILWKPKCVYGRIGGNFG